MMNRTKYTAQKSISRKEMGRINGGTLSGLFLNFANFTSRIIECPSAGPSLTGASQKPDYRAPGSGTITCPHVPGVTDASKRPNTRKPV